MLTPELQAAVDDAKSATKTRRQKIFHAEEECFVFKNPNTPSILADALVAADAENDRLRKWIEYIAKGTTPACFIPHEAYLILQGEQVPEETI